ncbi:LysR family transcriptional regulator [Ferrimonas balearica]|uniref:LysR family transcriptional regulator n=1 Tax=Ferrimonas balearica TaxID=44012 RepID=UPI001C99776C|nr:LysR family transcriptional regulator [Ferrimonas balearica]MBY5991034.1 LysR family transcriptional regulator [Ferrimonas balearica]
MDLRQFDLNLLVTFDAVMVAGSVSGAAERLDMTPAAVSQGISRLKALVSDPLFVRQGRGIVPTQAAHNLHRHVADALKELRLGLESQVAFAPHSSQRRFTLAGPSMLDLVVFPRFQRMAEEQGWGVQLSLLPHDDDPSLLEQQLCDRQVDLFIGTVQSGHPSIRQELVFAEQLVVAARRDHPRVQGSLDFDQYFAEKHTALRSRRLNTLFLSSLVQEALPVRQLAYESDSMLHLLVAASETNLLCSCPQRLAEQWAERLALSLYPLPFAMAPLQVHLNWHVSAEQDAGIQWLRATLKALVGGPDPS